MTGIVGRYVWTKVKRGDVIELEVCEVVACEFSGECGRWYLLVATHDGTLMSVSSDGAKLVPTPAAGEGPYR